MKLHIPRFLTPTEKYLHTKLVFKHGDDRVSLTSLVTSGNEGWLA